MPSGDDVFCYCCGLCCFAFHSTSAIGFTANSPAVQVQVSQAGPLFVTSIKHFSSTMAVYAFDPASAPVYTGTMARCPSHILHGSWVLAASARGNLARALFCFAPLYSFTHLCCSRDVIHGVFVPSTFITIPHSEATTSPLPTYRTTKEEAIAWGLPPLKMVAADLR